MRPVPAQWQARLEAVEKAREVNRAWSMTLVGFALAALVTVIGAIIAGAIGYGELRGAVDATRHDIGDLRQDIRDLRASP